MWSKDRFNFLRTECANSRYVLAAHHLRECDHIIEIGGFDPTIDLFLNHSPRTVTVIDPLIQSNTFRNGNTRVEYVKDLYQNIDLSGVLGQEGKTGLLFMGFTLKMDEDINGENDNLRGYARLLNNVDILIMETMIRRTPGFRNFESACTMAERAGFNKIMQCEFTMQFDSKFDNNDQFDSPRTYRVYENPKRTTYRVYES